MKKQEKVKSLKKSSGITLIALVITIVVLIILATVSINMILNDEGIIDSAEKSKELYQNASSKEQSELGTLDDELKETLYPNVNFVKSEDNQEVPVPKGYVASTIAGEKSVSTGFVIKKGDNGAATSGVNEFVWVPVSETSFNEMFVTSTTGPIYLLGQSGETGVKTEYYSNLRIRTGDSSWCTKAAPGDSSGVREPDLATDNDNDSCAVQAGYSNLADMAQGFVDDYANMRESIKKYKGFYIGRYELTGTVDNPTVQSGVVLTASSTGNWYGLYKASRNVAKEGEKVTSTMIWGCQWDETMNWLKNTKFKGNESAVDSDSSSWGNYNGSLQETGSNKENWSANNIYDLAGNYWEWSQEAYNTWFRVLRGGLNESTGSEDPASSRRNWPSGQNDKSISARTTLYINP